MPDRRATAGIEPDAFSPVVSGEPKRPTTPPPTSPPGKILRLGQFRERYRKLPKNVQSGKNSWNFYQNGGKAKDAFHFALGIAQRTCSWDPFTLSNSPLCNKSLFVVLRHPKLDWYNICFIYLYNAYIDIDLWSSIYFFIFWQFIFRLHMKIIWLAKLCTWSRRVSSNIIRASNAEISLKWKQLTTNIWMFP